MHVLYVFEGTVQGLVEGEGGKRRTRGWARVFGGIVVNFRKRALPERGIQLSSTAHMASARSGPVAEPSEKENEMRGGKREQEGVVGGLTGASVVEESR